MLVKNKIAIFLMLVITSNIIAMEERYILQKEHENRYIKSKESHIELLKLIIEEKNKHISKKEFVESTLKNNFYYYKKNKQIYGDKIRIAEKCTGIIASEYGALYSKHLSPPENSTVLIDTYKTTMIQRKYEILALRQIDPGDAKILQSQKWKNLVKRLKKLEQAKCQAKEKQVKTIDKLIEQGKELNLDFSDISFAQAFKDASSTFYYETDFQLIMLASSIIENEKNIISNKHKTS